MGKHLFITLLILSTVFCLSHFFWLSPVQAQDDPGCGGHLQPCCLSNSPRSPTQTTECDGNPPYKCVHAFGSFAPYMCCNPAVDAHCVLDYSFFSEAWCDPSHQDQGVQTSFGCLVFNTPFTFVAQILPWAVGIGGFIAFLALVYAGFLITTSGGDPKKVAAGKELIISVLIGLAFIALSILILNFIGANILRLGPLGFTG